MIGILALLIPVLVLFMLTTASLVPAAATVFCWGLLAFALISPLQMRVVNQAAQAPPNLASTRNQGDIQPWQRGRRLVGGLDLTHGLAYRELPWIGWLWPLSRSRSAFSHRLDEGVRRRRAGRRAMTGESTSLGNDLPLAGAPAFHLSHRRFHFSSC